MTDIIAEQREAAERRASAGRTELYLRVLPLEYLRRALELQTEYAGCVGLQADRSWDKML